MMYDAQGLYVAAVWHDMKPLFNVNRPGAFYWGYDGGDALQLRLQTDMLSTIEAWYCAPTGTPVLYQATAPLTAGQPQWNYSKADLMQHGAREACTRSNGSGVQEIFLPWTVITRDGKARKAGDELRWICNAWWSGVEGNRLPFQVNGRLQPRTDVVTLPMKATRDAMATVVIDDANGVRVRNLLAAATRKRGEVIATWDGLDNEGRVVAPGTYRYKVLTHTGIGWQYRMTFESPGNPPWMNEDGTGSWGGETTSPQGIATYGDQVFIGWPAAEKGGGLLAADLTGQRQWGMIGDPIASHVGTSN
jgi:hypothetical protein